MTYKLTTAEQATLDFLREKGEVFGLTWKTIILLTYFERYYWIDSDGLSYGDEAAHALMVRRGLKELGEGMHKIWQEVLAVLYYHTEDDILAAIVAALEDKT